MTKHIVKQGEHLSSIAEMYGFLSYEALWNDPKNKELKAKRVNPNVLFPGDVVEIPDRKPGNLPVATENVHVFQIRKDELELRIIIKDYLDQPIAGAECIIEVEGRVEKKTTSPEGLVRTTISRKARLAKLTIFGESTEVRIGHLDPVTESSGQIARLNNLGYRAGPIDVPDIDLLRSAIEEFQCDQNLKVNGVCDSSTQAKLKEVHGC